MQLLQVMQLLPAGIFSRRQRLDGGKIRLDNAVVYMYYSSKINKFSQHLREIQLLTGKIDKKSGSVNQCPGKTEGDVICLLGQKEVRKLSDFSVLFILPA